MICLLSMVLALGRCFVFDQPGTNFLVLSIYIADIGGFRFAKIVKLMSSIQRSESFIEPLDDPKV